MANIYQAGGKAAGKLMTKLSELTADLVSKGKTTDEVRDILSQKVPGATPAQIDAVVSPTLQTKVEQGKELAVIEPGMARPMTSSETGLVPTGRGRTTFIAGEEGVSSGSVAKPSPRTVEERIRSAKEPVSPPAAEANQPAFGTARKVGAGLVAAGALGKALPERGEKEDNKLPVYNVSPRITTDGELAPTDAEYQSALRSGADGVTKLMSTYDDLNEQLSKQPLVAYRSGANTKVQRAEQFLSSLEAMRPKPAKELAGPPVEAKTVPAKTKEREQAIEPAPVPVGGETKPSKGVSSNDVKVQSAVSQVKAGTVLQNDITSIEDKLKAGKAITRGDLFALTEKIDSIRPEEVKADAALVAELKSAREMARKAYQEQASRNEWAEVAQTLGNAVANFIAAQRGVADRALALPQVDYNARTQQALREYQTELGSVAEQEKALERGTERRERTAEKTAEEKRRAWERLLGIGEKQIEAQERQAAQDKNLSLQLQIAGAKEARAVNAAEKRAAIAEQKAQQQGDKQYVSALGKDIAQTNQQIEDFQRRLATATNVANSSTKDFDDNFNKYAALLGVTKEEAAFQKKGFFGGSSFDREAARKEAIADVLRLKEQVATLRQKKAQKEQEQQAVLTGGQPAQKKEPQPTPPSTVPEKSATVTLRDPKSGQTRQVTWDKAAQDKVQSGQLELVN